MYVCCPKSGRWRQIKPRSSLASLWANAWVLESSERPCPKQHAGEQQRNYLNRLLPTDGHVQVNASTDAHSYMSHIHTGIHIHHKNNFKVSTFNKSYQINTRNFLLFSSVWTPWRFALKSFINYHLNANDHY